MQIRMHAAILEAHRREMEVYAASLAIVARTQSRSPCSHHAARGLSPYSHTCMQIKRHAAVQEACSGEVERYAAKQEGIESAICAAGAAIDHDKAALNEAQNHRANIEEYEVCPFLFLFPSTDGDAQSSLASLVDHVEYLAHAQLQSERCFAPLSLSPSSSQLLHF